MGITSFSYTLISTQRHDVNAVATPASTLLPSYATNLRVNIRVGHIANSYSTIDRPMTRQLARQLSDSGKQHIPIIEPTTSKLCLTMCEVPHESSPTNITSPENDLFLIPSPGVRISKIMLINIHRLFLQNKIELKFDTHLTLLPNAMLITH